ncbi:MAG: hypothetical protein M3115_00025 [Thermoproteota archaeon]|nr:hypothetical protein [Thermoproteota archaeon]
MDEWTLIIVRSGSIAALTAIAATLARPGYKGSIPMAVVTILGIFAGTAGASHGPGEILQGDISPSGIFIAAWPGMISMLGQQPAMTLIPNLLVSGILTIILGSVITIWVTTRIRSKNGTLVFISLSITMLLVGGGLIPPLIGVAAGIIRMQIMQKDLRI